jgi:anaerobic ribonucleoside-triphosphate reductase activating protein
MVRSLASMKVDDRVRISKIVARTGAEGPGWRFGIWTQGCPLGCPGCCNPEMLSPLAGTEREVDVLLSAIAKVEGISGITLLGGEPFAQAAACALHAEEVQRIGLSVLLFSGYTLAELQRESTPAAERLLAATDVLIDGRFRRDLPEPRRRWIGSANQVIHFLSGRYQADDPRFDAPNTVELRLRGGELTSNGWPAAADAVRSGMTRWLRR